MSQDFNFKIDADKQHIYKKDKSPYPPQEDKFKKVLSKEEQTHDSQKGHGLVKKSKKKDGSEKAQKTPSLFDLSKESKAAVKPKENKEETDDTLSSFKKLSTRVYKKILSAIKSLRGEKSAAEAPLPLKVAGKQEKQQEVMPPTPFMREAPEMSAISPESTPVQGTTQGSRVLELQEVVDQIVSKIYTLTLKGQTDTSIQLKHPPLLEGANVVISSFKSAKGEFNIRFENLSTTGKQMLDMPLNQDGLKLALEQKGYVVHMITTTTETETPKMSQGEAMAKHSGERDKQQQKEKEQEQE